MALINCVYDLVYLENEHDGNKLKEQMPSVLYKIMIGGKKKIKINDLIFFLITANGTLNIPGLCP